MKYLILLPFLAACALQDYRDFEDQMDEENFNEPFFRVGVDFPLASGDTGNQGRTVSEIIDRTPLNKQELADQNYEESVKTELEQRISALSASDYQSYMQVQSALANHSEAIYFLDLSPEERSSFLSLKGIGSPSRNIASTHNSTGIALGELYHRLGNPVAQEQIPSVGEDRRRLYFNDGERYISVEVSDGRVVKWD